MSAWLADYTQSQPYSGTGDAYILASVECDAESDLPSVSYFSGWILDKGSIAHVIAGNTRYELDSYGAWILQEDSPFKDVYTKAQVNALVNDLDTTIGNLDNRIKEEIAALIDDGSKNRLNVFAISSQSINGIQWTINADGTVSATGTASANSFLYLIPNNTNISYGIETHISGCPAGGSSTTHEIQVAMTGGTTYHDYGDGETIPSTYVYRYFVCCVRSGQNIPTSSPLVFRPMICDKWKYDITNAFVPYSPSNAELAALIRQYHP